MESNVNEKIECLRSLPMDRYREWGGYMTKYHCDTICEVGVRQGFNFDYMIKSEPKLAVAVDCWLDDGVVGRNDSCKDQEALDKQYNKFKNHVSDKPFVQIVRKYSFDAVKDFPDEFFDFIFIDADHTYDGVSRDLVDWYPKVKVGGAFIGHDYIHRAVKAVNGQKIRFGVIEAVDEFVAKNGIKNFFVLEPNPMWGIIR
jgi:hypothetical protein